MKRTDMGILNELSEFIALRMKSFWEPVHDGNWIEHKAHIDYDLWFVQSGIVKITIDGIEHTANPGDVVLFYPGVPYRQLLPVKVVGLFMFISISGSASSNAFLAIFSSRESFLRI
ncbi:cupin domain-containing protein [Paenibacillus sp. Soil522]|uniref:cupin domain-containing protein n=1 Tax=Paenibacillus sp. Soil522 TaxID=1736388 RepID=UPI001F3CEFE3|nr:cupin domain-containing protein [Paenibacillus sp. Soil522]